MNENCHCIPLTFILIVLIFSSCTPSDEKITKKLYKTRKYLVETFKDKSIISRGETYYQLSYYKGQSANTFYFQKKENNLSFIDDTLQYSINEIDAFSSINISDSLEYVKAVSDEFKRLFNRMRELKIDNVSAEFAPLGIGMKIYFGDYKALLYVDNIRMVTNEEWKRYIKSGVKLDDNWFYVKDK